MLGKIAKAVFIAVAAACAILIVVLLAAGRSGLVAIPAIPLVVSVGILLLNSKKSNRA